MEKSVAKEIFILALLLMVIVFTIGIAFYDYIPSNKAVPGAIEYAEESEVTSTLQEIAATMTDAYGEENSDSLLKSYSIGTSDLKDYASKKNYESGKVDPFADYEEEVEENGNTTRTNTSSSSSSTTNNGTTSSSTSSKSTSGTTSNGTTQSTQGQSTNASSSGSSGTFFEKSNSK